MLTSSPAFSKRPSSMATRTGRSKIGLLGAILTTGFVVCDEDSCDDIALLVSLGTAFIIATPRMVADCMVLRSPKMEIRVEDPVLGIKGRRYEKTFVSFNGDVGRYSGRGAGIRPSCLRSRIRCQQTDYAHWEFDESGVAESARMDPRGRQGRERQGGELGDRVRYSQRNAAARAAQDRPARGAPGDRQRLSGKGWLANH